MTAGAADGPNQIVVVGGGLAAARTCEQLRRQGYAGHLMLLAAESAAPYDRPPLSKAVLLGARDETALPFDIAALQVDLRLATSATGLRPADAVVETTTGDLAYDCLVIATGASAVRLPGDDTQLTVRTLNDALTLRDRLRPRAHVVVVGASWIGAEVTTAALARGCRVTCIEMGDAPLAQALGREVGERLLPWWEGAELRLGTAVSHVEAGAVHLNDGTELLADAVVVGVGVRPETGWLASSGLELDRGIVVDERLRATERVVAVGDVAAWWSTRWSSHLRVEHWDAASCGGSVAAASALDWHRPAGDPHDPVPYFWSDQFGHKIQYVGHHTGEDQFVVRQAEGSDLWSAGWLDCAGALTAMLVIDRPRDLLQARKLIADGRTIRPELLADGTIALADTAHDIRSTRPTQPGSA